MKRAVIGAAALVAVILALVVLLPLMMFAGQPDASACGAPTVPTGAGAVTVGSTAGLTPHQLDIAGQIIAGARAGAGADGDKAALVLLIAGLQEDSLMNSTVANDHDSVGVFQFRPSMGWGTVAQSTDMSYEVPKMLGVLLAVPGWQTMEPGAAAQAIERSAFPGAYSPHLPVARALLANAGGSAVVPVTATVPCAPPAAIAGTWNGTDPGPGPQGVDHLTPRMIALKAAVKAQFPEFTDVGCWRPSDPFPDHPSGRACDFMIPGGGHDAAGNARGDALAEWVNANAKALGLQYMIWQQRYRPAGGGWAEMADRGGWTANHMDHVHMTVLP